MYCTETPNAVVGYLVAPFLVQKGSYCYKLLFEADTHRLCYLHKQKIGTGETEGFVTSELKKLGR